MSLSLIDGELWAGLYGDPEIAALLDDDALISAMAAVEAELAMACAEAGVVPEADARLIAETSRGLRIEARDLAAGAARDGVPVPALVAALRAAVGPAAAASLHWGATSQDIVDTATATRLALALDIVEARLTRLVKRLGRLAEAEAETVAPGRTRTQIGAPTTFGAIVASWGAPLLASLERLAALRPRLSRVSLHGAVGTDAALGAAAPAVRAALARRLGLLADDQPWHSGRDAIAECGAALAIVCGGVGKIGADVAALAQSGIAETRIAGGASSTMPHKSNPVAAEALVTLARAAARLQGGLFDALIHLHARDGAAWALEWQTLRQIVVATGASLAGATRMIEGLEPRRERMRANLDAEGFGPYAERAVFALARRLGRAEAEAAVKAALAAKDPLRSLARDHPELDWSRVVDPLEAAASAPLQARAFARRAEAIPSPGG